MHSSHIPEARELSTLVADVVSSPGIAVEVALLDRVTHRGLGGTEQAWRWGLRGRVFVRSHSAEGGPSRHDPTLSIAQSRG